MSQYIYTDMAAELHIKINLSTQENTHPINNVEQHQAAGGTVVVRGNWLVPVSKETFLE